MRLAAALLFSAALLGTSPAAAQNTGASNAGSGDQRHSTQWRTQSADVDSRRYNNVDAGRALSKLARCVVSFRPEKARVLFQFPDRSAEQMAAAGKVLKRDEEHCLNNDFNLRMSMPRGLLVSALAEALVVKDYADLPAVISRAPAAPIDEKLDGNQSFGRCVVQRDAAGVLALLNTPWDSPAEQEAIRGLLDDLSPCVASGQQAKITPAFVRQVTAVAAYRYAQQIAPRGMAAQ